MTPEERQLLCLVARTLAEMLEASPRDILRDDLKRAESLRRQASVVLAMRSAIVEAAEEARDQDADVG